MSLRKCFQIIGFGFWMGAILTPALAQETVVFDSSTPNDKRTIAADNTTYEGKKIVVRGITVTLLGTHAFASLAVENNGVVMGNMALTLSGDMSVSNGSSVHANGWGYGSTAGPGAGESADTPNYRGGGASYGGFGGLGYINIGYKGVYGSLTQPTEQGSGGGIGRNGDNTPQNGGAGGGAILLNITGTLTVDGTLETNGIDTGRGGAGSGGSLWLTMTALKGTGTIRANGGRANDNGGGGGGGRVALYYGLSTFTGVMGASGGFSNNQSGGAGTLYLKPSGQPLGSLILDNQDLYSYNNSNNYGNWTPLTGINTLDQVIVRRKAQLGPNGAILSLTVNRVSLETGGRLIGNIALTVHNDLNVGDNSGLSATGWGYSSENGPGAGNGTLTPNYRGGGASYGGLGGAGYGDVGYKGVYGSVTQPVDQGSGGGTGRNGDGSSQSGGAGGGTIRLEVQGTLTLDGTIETNGTDTNRGGAGSGGSAWITVATLAGKGALIANGGRTYDYGGGGGGGRIALYYDTSTYTGQTLASGGFSASYQSGGAGTVYLKASSESLGSLIIDNQDLYSSNNGNSYGNWTPLTEVMAVNHLTVRRKAQLSPLETNLLTLTTNDIALETGGKILGNLNLTVMGNMTLGSNTCLSATGWGYAPSTGPGAGSNYIPGSNVRGGGGGYGGKGGSGDVPGGGTYGSEKEPADPGSGGGSGNNGDGGNGGGTIRLHVYGTLQIDPSATVQANGNDAGRGGAGSGGSIWLTVASLTGTGAISANGGYSNDSGGGGGGGRVALYYTNKPFTGSLLANGGPSNAGSSRYGAAGTVYTEVFNNAYRLIDLNLAPAEIAGGQGTVGAVGIQSAAPEGGIVVYLFSNRPDVSTVPTSVTIPQGQSTVSFPLTTVSVNATQAVQIRAVQAGESRTAGLTVRPWLAALKLNPGSVNGNVTVTGTLMLNLPAPSSGLTVTLASGDGSVTFPGGTNVTVTGGATSKSFDIKVGSVTSAKAVLLTASFAGQSISTNLYINPGTAQVKNLAFSPASVIGGNMASGVVTLTKAAPTGGVWVALSSNDPVASVPDAVLVAAGKTSGQFNITTQAVNTTKSVQLTATLGNSKTATLTVRLPGVQTLSLLPSEVVGGENAYGVVTLDAAPTTSVTVTITSDKAQASPEASLVIPPGQTTGSFLINTTTVTLATTALITARANGISKSQPLSILTQGQNNNNVNLSGVITLQALVPDADTQTLAFTFRPEAGGDEITKTTPLAPDGLFSLSDIPRGRFTLHIKANKWLAKNLSLDTSNGDVSGITATLLAGDANNDNACDIFDLGTLAEDFNSSPGDGNWNGGRSDFNGDRSVDIFDLAILAENFNRQGDP